MGGNLTVVALIAFLAGAVVAALVILAAIAYRGAWVPLDDPECERDEHPGGCTAPTRDGWSPRTRVRWRPWFRCAGCECRWLRRFVWALVPESVLEAMDEREDEDRGVAS